MADISSNLVVYYPFDTNFLDYATGTAVVDASNNDGSIDNVVYKLGGGSLYLNSSVSPEYVQLNSTVVNTTAFPDINQPGVTFAAWIKLETVSNLNYVFCFTNNNNALSSDIEMVVKPTGLTTTVYNTGNNQNRTVDTSYGTIDDLNWHHIVWSLQFASGNGNSNWVIYIDGIQLQTSANGRYPESLTRNTCYIGRYVNTTTGLFNGNIDDFRIYYRVLTQTDVTALYNYTYGPAPPQPIDSDLPCFHEDTKILCLKDGQEQYIPIKELRNGDYIKTINHGYLPITMIGKRVINNPSHKERIKDRLYHLDPYHYPELLEDIYITGCHSILVHELTPNQKLKTLEEVKDIYVTDEYYRLMAFIDDRSIPYTEEGEFTIYHLALENEDYFGNYGIYASGLLVETISIRNMKEMSDMKIIE
jgi:hypothetical protein